MPRLLLAADGSSHALKAVEYVGFMFKDRNIDIKVIHVLPPIPPILREHRPSDKDFTEWQTSYKDKWVKMHQERAEGILKEVRQTLLQLGIKEDRIEMEVYPGITTVAKDLCFYARGGAFDALILGRRGISKIKELIVGSTCERVIHAEETIPVCIVTGDINSKKVLIPVDGSAQAERAVKHASLILTGIPDISITLLHILTEPYLPHWEESHIKFWERLVEEKKADITPFLDRAKEVLLSSGIPKEAIKISLKEKAGAVSVTGEILTEQEEGGYGTIIMGRRGLSGLTEFVGSISKKVLTQVNNCSLWLVE